MSYSLVDELKKAHPVSQLCEVLDVQKSSYYYWQGGHRQPTAQRLRLQVHARAVHMETHQTYGSRRMSAALKAQGLAVGRHRARSLMREAGLVAIRPKKRHSYPAGEVSRVAANHLDRQFEASQPNQKWVGDITYLWTSVGWVYLAVVLDLFSRKVVGWAMSAQMNTALVETALHMALQTRQPDASLLHHSDQGSQYTSAAYQNRLAGTDIQLSMSRVGNCYDNAVAESFFGTLKAECVTSQFVTHALARTTIFEYIEVWYNRQRLHSTLGYLSPVDFEQQHGH